MFTKKRSSLLYVDDQEENLRAFKRVFKKDFIVYTALSGEEGLDLFEKHQDISLLVSDQRMPGMSGVDFLNACKLINPRPIRIIITGYADLESTINAINDAEIYRFIPKPWERLDLKQTLLEAQKKYDLVNELELKNKELESLDKLKNKFMMLINHELKSPLTIQKSYLELLAEEIKEKEQTELLNKSIGGTEKMETLVEEILFFLKLQEKTDLKSQNLSLKDIHKDLSEMKIKTDKTLFKEAFERLLKNANDHKKASTSVKVHVKDSVLIIENTIGSSEPLDINLILKPFEIHEESFNHSKGLGLGLSISSLILNKLGFEVSFKTGKKFEVRINLENHLK